MYVCMFASILVLFVHFYVPTDPCNPDPCSEHGMCNPDGDPLCICDNGYSGEFCDKSELSFDSEILKFSFWLNAEFRLSP